VKEIRVEMRTPILRLTQGVMGRHPRKRRRRRRKKKKMKMMDLNTKVKAGMKIIREDLMTRFGMFFIVFNFSLQ